MAKVSPQAPATNFPAQLNAYIAKYVQLTPAERSRMTSGAPVVKLLPSDPAREVAVFGAVWIKGSSREYVKLVQNIEQFERGGPFRVTKRISDPPAPSDFVALELPEDDLKSLRTCRVGSRKAPCCGSGSRLTGASPLRPPPPRRSRDN
jgi:hypothetical protein